MRTPIRAQIPDLFDELRPGEAQAGSPGWNFFIGGGLHYWWRFEVGRPGQTLAGAVL